MNKAAESGVLLNISEMIDLAIGTPEIGVVDFCMLQTVLHCLAQQLQVLDKNVELRGSISVLPVGRQPPDAQTISVNELLLETDGTPAHPNDQDTILIVERVQRDSRDANLAAQKVAAGAKPSKSVKHHQSKTSDQGGPKEASGSAPVGPGQVSEKAPQAAPEAPRSAPEVHTETEKAPEAPTETGKAPETPTDAEKKKTPVKLTVKPSSSHEKISLVTLSKFNVLESAVEDLKNRVYGSLPKNEEILQEVRSQTNLKAITDMWTNLNVSSRLEAAEEAISKLSSLLQDVIGDTAELQKKVQERPAASDPRSTIGVVTAPQPTTAGAAATAAEPVAIPSEQSMTIPPGVTEPSGNIKFSQSMAQSQSVNWDLFATKEEMLQLYDILQGLKEDHDWLTDAFVQAMKDMNKQIEEPKQSFVMPPKAQMSAAASTLAATSTADTGFSRQQTIAIHNKLDELEAKLKLCNDIIFSPHGNVQEQIDSLQDQLEYLQRTHPMPAMDTSDGAKHQDIASDLQALMQLFQTVQNMQMQLQQVHETALQLASEKEDRQHNINSLLEQIELLKSIKLDREDMVEALADKADMRMLARKVSHDQFEMACDDLSRGLEHALGKLNVQESLWQQALDDIQREIESKLDKVELSPVKDFFNNKLRQLQENLKQMADLRREAQAAGTKRRLLRDVNCISCDAKAVMAMDEAGSVPSKPLPPSLSMKPYLSYELDAIRKAQASGLPQRNMHDWENVSKQMTTPRQPQKVRSETDKHICNRYCGGSHTTTTPSQRVARLGHFIKQWGPEVLPLSSAYATGDDGRLYKVTATETPAAGPGGATDVPCTPKSPIKKEGKSVSKPPKPLGLTPECRCLEERPQKK